MHQLPIVCSALIPHPPEQVYSIIADYREGHPAILPKPPFVSLQVEEGGVGEGTVIHVVMKVMGMNQGFRALVSEPEPGRVLVETSDTGYATSFRVDPEENGAHSRVTISTLLNPRPGLMGALERRLMRRMLPPLYERELAQLAAVAAKGRAVAA